MKNLKIARVHWRDPSHYRSEDTIEWLSEHASTTEFVTVGHVLKMGRRDIVLAHEINDEDKARHTSVIPRSLVIKIEYGVEWNTKPRYFKRSQPMSRRTS